MICFPPAGWRAGKALFLYSSLSLPAGAEKAVKGWLVYHDQSFEKPHDLRLLVTLASEVEPKFKDWFDVAEQVSPYATAYRYPGEGLEPAEEEFQQAFKAANQFYECVCSLLPTEVSSP